MSSKWPSVKSARCAEISLACAANGNYSKPQNINNNRGSPLFCPLSTSSLASLVDPKMPTAQMPNPKIRCMKDAGPKVPQFDLWLAPESATLGQVMSCRARLLVCCSNNTKMLQ